MVSHLSQVDALAEPRATDVVELLIHLPQDQVLTIVPLRYRMRLLATHYGAERGCSM
jgi:hypothetical protein